MASIKPSLSEWDSESSFFWFSSPDWHSEAACRGMDPEIFFPERGASDYQAKKTCRTCPVSEECAESGMREDYGIWGGDHQGERSKKKRQRRLELVTRG